MLKFVRAVSIIYLITLILFLLVIIERLGLPHFMGNPVIYTTFVMLIIIPFVSLVLLFNETKFSPKYKFRLKKLAISGHITFIVLFILFFTLDTSFVRTPEGYPISRFVVYLMRSVIAFALLLPSINFISIFEYHFVKRLFASSEKGIPDA